MQAARNNASAAKRIFMRDSTTGKAKSILCTSRADDPAFQRIHLFGQSEAWRTMAGRPRRLDHAEHRVEAVATGVMHQRVALRMGELQAQREPRVATFQPREQVLARDEAVGRLLRLLVALVAAPSD